jgi:hypothetical protein
VLPVWPSRKFDGDAGAYVQDFERPFGIVQDRIVNIFWVSVNSPDPVAHVRSGSMIPQESSCRDAK